MSEVDVNGQVLSTFTDVKEPHHLSTDSEGHLFVADYYSDCILLLNSQLRLERVLIDTNSEIELRDPRRLSFNELTSQLRVAHGTHHTDYFISSLSVR